MSVVGRCICAASQFQYYRELNKITTKTILQSNFRHRLNFYRTVVSAGAVAKPRLSRKWLYAAVGLTGGAAGLEIKRRVDSSKEPSGIPPPITPSRSVKFAQDTSGLKITLYQYQTCPFCCKVRAFLNYHGISYDIVEVNPVMRNQIKFSKQKKVPIVIVEDKNGVHQLNDSSMIISCLQSYLLDPSMSVPEIANYYPLLTYRDDNDNAVTDIVNRYHLMFGEQQVGKSKEEILLERKWREWADKVLVHTLSPNIYRTREEAMDAFQWFSDVGEYEKNFSAWERYIVLHVGSLAMYFIGKRLIKKHRLKEDVRQSLYDASREWTKALGRKPFMGGDNPNLADLAVFGVLNAIEGCATFQDLKANTHIYSWYSRVKNELAPPAHA